MIKKVLVLAVFSCSATFANDLKAEREESFDADASPAQIKPTEQAAPRSQTDSAKKSRDLEIELPVIEQPVRDFRADYNKLTNEILNAQANSTVTNPVYEREFYQRANEDAVLKASLVPGPLETLGAALTGNTGNSIYRAIFKPRFEEEAGFEADATLLPKGADSELREQYFGAKSKAEAAYALKHYEEEQFRIKTVMSRGKVSGTALRLLCEIFNPITGIALLIAALVLAVIRKNQKGGDSSIKTMRNDLTMPSGEDGISSSWDERLAAIAPLEFKVPEPAVPKGNIYEVIAEELATGSKDNGLWIRLFAECDGDETKTKVRYIKERASKLSMQGTLP